MKGFRILLVSQFFPPDVVVNGIVLGDLAHALLEGGNHVRVISGRGGYTTAPREYRDLTANRSNLVLEPVTNTPFSHSRPGKILSYLSFYIGATLRALLGSRPDVVVTMTAPPGLSWIGWLLQRLRGSRHVVWEMDVYPDIAVDLGLKWVGALGWFLDFPRNRADIVIALGEDMKARLLARGVPEDRIRICENWADGDAVRPAALWPDPLPLRVLYSGNLGMAHDVDTMQSVMSSFREDNRLEFIYAGSGPRRKELELACAGFPFVTFLPWAERTSLGDSLGSAHIGLVTQRAETIGTVVPSKIYGLLAAGRPLLYIGPAASTAAMVIRRHNCGWHFECGDEAGVRALLERLLREPELIRIAGASARRALESEYDYKIGVARVVEVVLSQARQDL